MKNQLAEIYLLRAECLKSRKWYLYENAIRKKVAQNVEKIIREEMNNAGAKEVTMPMLLPVDLFENQEDMQHLDHQYLN